MPNWFDTNKPDDVALSGWLDKQSPSMFTISWQKRYCVVTCSDKVFRYFKNEDDKTEAGSILLSGMETIGYGGNDTDCKIIAIKCKDRIYAFECANHNICEKWIKTIMGIKSGRITGAAGVVDTPSSASGDNKASTSVTKSASDFLKYGYLNKESHNALILTWQQRYVEIDADNCNLYYYREEPPLERNEYTVKPAGSMNCTTIEYIRPKGDKGGMTINRDDAGNVFEMKGSDGKILVFQSKDTDEMFQWIQIIEYCMPENKRNITIRLARMQQNNIGNEMTANNTKSNDKGESDERSSHDSDDDSAFGGQGIVDNLDHNRFSHAPNSTNTECDVYSSDVRDSSGTTRVSQVPTIIEKVPETFYMKGYMQKQSNNKFRAIAGMGGAIAGMGVISGKRGMKYQKRFITISKYDHTLRYYKDEKSSQVDICPDITLGCGSDSTDTPKWKNTNQNCLGHLDIYEVDFVRSYDNTSTCTKLEMRFGDRTFVFDAETVANKEDWVTCIMDIMKIQAEELKKIELKKMEEDIPPLVRLFDREGIDTYKAHIKTVLTEMYPPAWSSIDEKNDDIATDDGAMDATTVDDTDLSKHLSGVRHIIAWLEKSFLPNVRKSAKCPARYDVMAVTVDVVNRYLDLRLMLIINDNPVDDQEVLQVANTSEIYDTIRLLTRHQQILNKLYCPVYFKTKHGQSGTRMSTNIRFTTTQFSDSQDGRDSAESDINDVRAALQAIEEGNDDSGDSGSDDETGQRFNSENYTPKLGGRGRTTSTGSRSSLDDDDKGIPIVSPNSSGCDIAVNSAGIPTYRFHCEIFEQIPYLCRRYVEGSYSVHDSSIVVKNGTGEHLVNHCDKVWEKMLVNVTEFVHRHQDGTFYTETPTLMWQCLHQHIQLAISADSTLLHIMVADKISLCLNRIVRTITNYVEFMDTESDEELREMELEFLCALINDNALHIEEVITLVEGFENEAVKERVNDSFDSVTDQLVICGQACLNRLVKIIILDVDKQFHEIYSEELWLNGSNNQCDVICATVSDYMADFEEFLMPFWYSKFSTMILEEVILQYCTNILKHSDTDAPEDCIGDMVTFGRINRDINVLNSFLRKAMPLSIEELHHRMRARNDLDTPIRESELNELPEFEDINETNDYLVSMELLNELNYYLTAEYSTAAAHAMQRIAAFPSSAEAIEWFFTSCIAMREDCDEEEEDECEMYIQPALKVAPDAASYNAKQSIAEGPLGTLYDNLWAMADTSDNDRDSGFGRNSCIDMNGNLRMSTMNGKPNGNTMTHKLKIMTNVPLQAMKDSLRKAVQTVMDDDDDDDDNDTKRNSEVLASNRLAAGNKAKIQTRRGSLAVLEAKSKVRVEALTAFLEEEEDDENEILGLEEEQQNVQYDYDQRMQKLQFTLENHLEKKSHTSKMWQKRYFKIITRENSDIIANNMQAISDLEDDELVSYHLMYYKNKGDPVLKSFNLLRLINIKIVECNRELVWLPEVKEMHLATELANSTKHTDRQRDIAITVQVHNDGDDNVAKQFLNSALSTVKINKTYVMEIKTGIDPTGRDTCEHELTLRTHDIDKFNKWITALIKLGKLHYNPDNGCFTF